MDSGFKLAVEPDASVTPRPYKPYDIVVLIKPSTDIVEKNNQRYMYGSFVKQLRKVRSYYKADQYKPQAIVPTFNVKLSDKQPADADYTARITFTDYDLGYDAGASSHGERESKAIATRCFLMAVDIENPTNSLDRFSFKSNGCPGMSDPRLVAKKVFGILFNDLWAVDSTKTYTLILDGSSSTSWYSDLETDNEVDNILGYKEAVNETKR